LGWRPALRFDDAIAMTAHWYRQFDKGAHARATTLDQITAYMAKL
jgi:hypothetical protein